MRSTTLRLVSSKGVVGRRPGLPKPLRLGSSWGRPGGPGGGLPSACFAHANVKIGGIAGIFQETAAL